MGKRKSNLESNKLNIKGKDDEINWLKSLIGDQEKRTIYLLDKIENETKEPPQSQSDLDNLNGKDNDKEKEKEKETVSGTGKENESLEKDSYIEETL